MNTNAAPAVEAERDAGARRVMLTGATGFLGGGLARRLAGDGDRLRCLVRESSDTRDLERLGAELVVGDVTDGDALARALDGVDLAYHLAAAYEIGVVDEDRVRRVNVGGTRAFLEAVERAGTPHSIYVSTTGALAPVDEGLGDETTPFPPGYRAPTAYQRTKVEAHRLAREAQRAGLPLTIASPAYVYGPGDRGGPSGRIIADLLAGRLPGLIADPVWFSFVHVDDVIDGLARAGRSGRTGTEYILSGEPASINDFLERAAALAGRRAPRLRFPVPLARLTGAVLDGVSRLTGQRFPISRESVGIGSRWRFVHTHERASRELDWTPRPLEQGLPETVAWFEERGDAG